jgi:hypothetical protein
MPPRISRVEIVAVALAAGTLVAGATAHASRDRLCRQPAWHTPTPPANAAVDTQVGVPFRLEVAAYTAGHCARVRIAGLGLPGGATVATRPGRSPQAEVRWTPSTADIGRVPIIVTATELSRPYLSITRTIVAIVHGPLRQLPGAYPVSRPDGPTSWSYVLQPATARRRPAAGSAAVGTLATLTSDGAWNLVPLLAAARDRRGALWLEVPLAMLPNGTTGWVPATALGPARTVDTQLVVDREAQTATLYRGGAVAWSAPVGVGAPGTSTPAGTFYIRDELTGFDDASYGPVAFGTNAVSAVETDWPGGGVIGIHGTDQPGAIPGAVSHGCIRMRNADILALARLLPLGTPVVIR